MLAAPLGAASVIGVDPGLRTGCKCAAIDATGKFLGTITVYITQGDAQLAKAKEDFVAFVRKHQPRAIAVGNGTGGREAEAFVKKTLAEAGLARARSSCRSTRPARRVYSASDLAREEFPELDLTIRGAISIARRLQDPLAELVKIEPKSIGVGQYQHDVHQPLLGEEARRRRRGAASTTSASSSTPRARSCSATSPASASRSRRRSSCTATRRARSASRAQLMEIGGLGPKAFEQAAGLPPHPRRAEPARRARRSTPSAIRSSRRSRRTSASSCPS